MMNKILLKDAQVVEPQRISRQCVLIEGERIVKIAPDISADNAYVIDCHELLAIPGMIDAHVHFRQPGMEHKADILHEAQAAVLGGVTSYMEMPNTLPPTLNAQAVADKQAIAARDSAANYAFYLGADDRNLEDVKRADPTTIPAIKVYMGSTTGSLLLDDEHILHQVFKAAPMMICAHCEDNAYINAQLKRVKAQYGDNIPFALHPIIRGRDCCINSAKMAINTALDTGAKLHIMHLSTKEECAILQYFAQGDLATRQISGEGCIPHLFFSEGDYARLKGLLKCNPAVKSEGDRLSLIKAIKSGAISTVGTDHAPHEWAVKCGSYLNTASGIPSVQFALQALLELWQRRELTLEEVIKVTSGNVATRFNIADRGFIKEGYYADIALVNLVKGQIVTSEIIASKCGFSPFTGHRFNSSITHTIVSGTLVVENGKLTGLRGGKALRFART
ncbi:MAG: amidohydrolase family protein [Candidatus Anaerobiospirillum merdipullorum]|uniref:Amidohydrolase family protein n=1 Tax=Candidatus Anaerobiospirillum merdipullorum TaxID=2838450 RepID=A0A9E2KQ03_9GAMM|nr:amidohydrolase family protein [Candidatus Anaerobiospirillum merdipullorum]